jgi:hypothetical protein
MRDKVICRHVFRGQTTDRISLISVLAAKLAVSGCAVTGTYPVGGEQCAPTDPVQQIGSADCVGPGT